MAFGAAVSGTDGFDDGNIDGLVDGEMFGNALGVAVVGSKPHCWTQCRILGGLLGWTQCWISCWVACWIKGRLCSGLHGQIKSWTVFGWAGIGMVNQKETVISEVLRFENQRKKLKNEIGR